MRRARWLILLILVIIGVPPARAEAQQPEKWQVSFVPLYFWATKLDGHLSAGPASVPVSLSFADAADSLGGAFSFHFEASKGRWGLLTDLNFIQLASSATFAVGPLRDIQGDFELNNVMFELGGLYALNEAKGFAVIGGLRTYTLSPKVRFTGSLGSQAAPVDDSETSPNGFVGVVLRPRISDKWSFIGRADVGGGDADLTWSAVAGLEYRLKPRIGLEFGYKALGIDVKGGDRELREYDVTHYGPIFGLRLHWGQ
jgi:hypothetical protein